MSAPYFGPTITPPLVQPTRILVIRFSSIGDIVLTTPVLRVLKDQLEGEVEIHYLTKKKFATLLEANPRISKIHTIESSVQEILPELEKVDFDYIIDLHNNIRSYIVKRRLKVLNFTFSKHNFKKWLLVNTGINLMPEVHVVRRYLATLNPFGIREDEEGLEYYMPDGTGISEALLPETFKSGFIAFAIGGAHEGKKMTPEKMGEICKMISFPVALIGGNEDADAAKQITLIAGKHVLDLTGQLTLHQSADVVRRAKVVISGDTGMMHIAAAFRKKVISIWGCTTPSLGMYPYRPDPASVILEPRGRKRRPCSKLGNRCKYGMENRCILLLDNAIIVEKVSELFGD